jgi:PAS domain S-box-containing protein
MVGVYIRKGRQLLYVNPRFLEIFGYTEEELYNDFDITNLIAESDRSFIIENLEANALNNITSHNYEFNGLHKTGKIIYTEYLDHTSTMVKM